MVILRFIKPTFLNPIKSSLHKYLSTAAEPLEIHLSKFRTTERDPTKHSLDHAAMYYTVEPEAYKQLFTHGGFPNDFKENVTTFNECCVMVRPFALEVMKYLRKADYSLPAIRYMLYGETGVGKSITLAHLIHYASIENMLIIHVPYAPNYTRKPKDTAISTFNPEFMDTPSDSSIWLKRFSTQNSKLLADLNLKTSRTYTWSKREITEAGQPLTDVIEHGLNRGKHSTDCVAVLLKEIKEQSSSGNFRSFVVIDGVNAFFSKTQIRKVDKSLYDPEQITLVRSFIKLLSNDWNNAAIVVTVDAIAAPVGFKEFHTPLKLLGKKGFELFEPFVPIEVNNYSRKEILSCLDYYIDRNWIQNKNSWTDAGKEEIIFLSGSNPYDLMTICNYR